MVTRTLSLALAALVFLSMAAPASAQGQPAQTAEPQAAPTPALPAPTTVPTRPTGGFQPHKQTKKMGHAGKKMSRHHGRRGAKGVSGEGSAGEPDGSAAPLSGNQSAEPR